MTLYQSMVSVLRFATMPTKMDVVSQVQDVPSNPAVRGQEAPPPTLLAVNVDVVRGISGASTSKKILISFLKNNMQHGETQLLPRSRIIRLYRRKINSAT